MKVSSKRGEVVCKAYVTKRIKPLIVDGKPAHVIGVPLRLGLHRPGPEGLRREHADAIRRRRQYADAGVQGVPGERRKRPAHRSQPEANDMSDLQSARLCPALGLDDDAPVARSHEDQVAKLIDVSRCIGMRGLPVGLHGVERPASGDRAFRRLVPRTPWTWGRAYGP